MLSAPPGGNIDDWKTPQFRQGLLRKIEDAIQQCGGQTQRSAAEMESQVFAKAKTREEYVSFIGRLIVHMSELKNKQQAMLNQQNQNMLSSQQNQGMMAMQQNQGLLGNQNPGMMGQQGQGMMMNQPNQGMMTTQQGQLQSQLQGGQMMPGSQQQGMMAANQQQGMMASNQQQGMMASNQQQGMMAGNQQQGMMAGNQQQGMMTSNQQQVMMGGNQQQGMMAGNQQQGMMSVQNSNMAPMMNTSGINTMNMGNSMSTMNTMNSITGLNTMAGMNTMGGMGTMNSMGNMNTMSPMNSMTSMSSINNMNAMTGMNQMQGNSGGMMTRMLSQSPGQNQMSSSNNFVMGPSGQIQQQQQLNQQVGMSQGQSNLMQTGMMQQLNQQQQMVQQQPQMMATQNFMQQNQVPMQNQVMQNPQMQGLLTNVQQQQQQQQQMMAAARGMPTPQQIGQARMMQQPNMANQMSQMAAQQQQRKARNAGPGVPQKSLVVVKSPDPTRLPVTLLVQNTAKDRLLSYLRGDSSGPTSITLRPTTAADLHPNHRAALAKLLALAPVPLFKPQPGPAPELEPAYCHTITPQYVYVPHYTPEPGSGPQCEPEDTEPMPQYTPKPVSLRQYSPKRAPTPGPSSKRPKLANDFKCPRTTLHYRPRSQLSTQSNSIQPPRKRNSSASPRFKWWTNYQQDVASGNVGMGQFSTANQAMQQRPVGPGQFVQTAGPQMSMAPSPSSMVNQGQMNQIPAQAYGNSPGSAGMMHSPAAPTMNVNNLRPYSNQMVPSPSGVSLNTPHMVAPTPSPRNSEDQACFEKIKELRRYTDLLQRMIAKIGNEDVEKSSKMKKLLDILTNPNQRVSMEILLKCEIALKKMERQHDAGGLVAPAPAQIQQPQPQSQPCQPTIPGKETISPFQQILDVVCGSYNFATSSHTYHRSFQPVVDALIGTSGFDDDSFDEDTDEDDEDLTVNGVSWLVSKELRSLDSIVFKARLVSGSKNQSAATIRCSLVAKNMPCVPPLNISVTKEYPHERPTVLRMKEDYCESPFLRRVVEIQRSRMLYLPAKLTVTHLLRCWEMSVRQAVKEKLDSGDYSPHQLLRPLVAP